MKDRAYAKINLSLNILRRREDGYHDIDSIMIPIQMWDELEIVPSEEMEYSCNVPILFDSHNTVVKAIEYMKSHYGIRDNFKVRLYKLTPSQAGLGGGSSDGAAALRILNRMYHLNITDSEIKEACLSIGADVLFTYYNRPARVQGIGDELSFFDVKENRSVLLIKPKTGVSTKAAYETLNIENCAHPNVVRIEEALKNGGDYENEMGNSLEEPSLRLCPDIASVKKELNDLGFKNPLMSGSGSTVFVLSENKEELLLVKKKLKGKYPFIYVTDLLIHGK